MINYKEIGNHLSALVELKKNAALRFASSFKIEPEEIFYYFVNGQLPERGEISDGSRFLFHGYGCSIKNEIEGWAVELEFGPNGQYSAFDKYTICHDLGYATSDCERVINKLVNKGMVALATSCTSCSLKTSTIRNISEIDLLVSDRYILLI